MVMGGVAWGDVAEMTIDDAIWLHGILVRSYGELHRITAA